MSDATTSNKIGLVSMILLGINSIIGSGIFLLPGQVTSLVGSWSLMIYLLVGALVLSIAWCFAQCSKLFSRNGGAYLYAKEAFGNFIGFEVGLMRWIIGLLAWASLAVGFITALSSIFPIVIQEPFRSIFLSILIIGLGLLNIRGVTFFKILNNIVTLGKLIPIFLFILMGSLYIEFSNFSSISIDEFQVATFSSAALMIFYAFSGFDIIVVAAGEMENPKKNSPIVIMFVLCFCSLIYFLIQFVAMGLLGKNLAGSITPLVDASEFFLGPSGKWMISASMLVAIFGVNLSASFVTPRSAVALAEDKMIPQWMAYRGKYGTPIKAIAVSVAFTLLLAVSFNFSELVAISVISRLVQYFSTCLAVGILNRRFKQENTFKKKCLLIILPAFALIGMTYLLFYVTLTQLLWGFGGLIIGIPLYWLQKQSKDLEQETTFA